MERVCWYPLRDRGTYIPVEYTDDYYLTKKEWICNDEESCQAICDRLNTEIDDKLTNITNKCYKDIVRIEKNYNIDRRFLILKFQSMFENLKAEGERQ